MLSSVFRRSALAVCAVRPLRMPVASPLAGITSFRRLFSSDTESSLAKEVIDRSEALTVREQLKELRRDRISVHEFHELCAKNGIVGNKAEELLSALHTSSFVLRFRVGGDALTDVVFLSPERVITELHKVLDVSGLAVEKKKTQLAALYAQKAEMDLDKAKIDKIATRRADMVIYAGSLIPVGAFTVLARMTWWEFSWDIVEPISYFVTAMGPIAAFYVYFALTKKEFSYSSWRSGMIAKRQVKLYDRYNFDIEKYNLLLTSIRKREEELHLLQAH